jgi:hypothetical protein
MFQVVTAVNFQVTFFCDVTLLVFLYLFVCDERIASSFRTEERWFSSTRSQGILSSQ